MLSLTKMLESVDSVLTAKLVYKILEEKNLVKRVHYDSSSENGKMRSFIVLCGDGLELGENRENFFRPPVSDITFRLENLHTLISICAEYLHEESKRIQSGVVPDKKPLSDQVFVLTGTLSKMDRSIAKEHLQNLGAKITGSVSTKTHALVAGEKAGSKLKRAKDIGVKVLNEAAFIGLLTQYGIELEL